VREVQIWFDEYSESHRHPVNKGLHYVCVPLIVVSLIGMLWALPIPAEFGEISPALNWGSTFLLASVVYYFILSMPLAFGMLPFVLLTVLAVLWLDSLPGPLWSISAGLFVLAWVGQFAGHAVEGRSPSFFRDMQYLMMGPVWLLAGIYKRLGIPY
jgi:uncharacterized membrane protein YGL010W